MRYRRPFTPEQRRDAARVYASLRSHVHVLRRSFPPRRRQQRDAFRRYRDLVHAIGSELLKVDALVKADELNRLLNAAVDAAAEYQRLWEFADGDDDE